MVDSPDETKPKHECDEYCKCPVHHSQLLWSAEHGVHACQNMHCRFAEGFERRNAWPRKGISLLADGEDPIHFYHQDVLAKPIRSGDQFKGWLTDFQKLSRERKAAIAAQAEEAKKVKEWQCNVCRSDQWVGWRAGPAHEGFERFAQCVPCGHVQDLPASAKFKVCPTCASLQPHMHPAVQSEGEVQLCKDAWHSSTHAGREVMNKIIGHAYYSQYQDKVQADQASQASGRPAGSSADGGANETAIARAQAAVAAMRATSGVPASFGLGQAFWPGLEDLLDAAADLMVGLSRVRASGGKVSKRPVVKPMTLTPGVKENVLYYKNEELISRVRAALARVSAALSFFTIYNEEVMGPDYADLDRAAYEGEKSAVADWSRRIVRNSLDEIIEEHAAKILHEMILQHSSLMTIHGGGRHWDDLYGLVPDGPESGIGWSSEEERQEFSHTSMATNEILHTGTRVDCKFKSCRDAAASEAKWEDDGGR